MSSKIRITKETEIEDLVSEIPQSVTYLMDKGINCVQCGEPAWGTLESIASEKGFNDYALEEFVKDINELQLKN